jgi:hypothetical protein
MFCCVGEIGYVMNEKHIHVSHYFGMYVVQTCLEIACDCINYTEQRSS